MTLHEAKLILQSYRPGSEDDADPFFTEALELLHSNKELGEWFDQEQSFDSLMRHALGTQIPPSGLRNSILARKTATSLVVQKNPLRALHLIVGLTAALVFFVGIALFQSSSSPGKDGSALSVASFTREALAIKQEDRISLASKSADPAQLRSWLAERGAPHDFVIPPGLLGVPSLGCQSYQINGHQVALICFNLGNNKIAHLFVVRKSALSDASGNSTPQLHENGGLAYATWSSGDMSYVLTGDNVTRESLQKLI